MATIRRAKRTTNPKAVRASTSERKAEATLAFATVREWDAWLKAHHVGGEAVLLRIPKGAGKAFGYSEALNAALAWGWIDSQKSRLDETAFLQRFSPRGPRSPWSQLNCARAEALIASKKMKPAGLAEVESARADGRWERAYRGPRASTTPPDLAAALAACPRAERFFTELDGANRYAILYRVETAKRAETRAERVARFVDMCARGETVHPPRQRPTARTPKKER